MTGRVQTLRSSVSGNRPVGRQPGEIYVNWADGQIGVINSANGAQDFVAVRFFTITANYAVGDFVVQSGTIYRAIAPSSAGTFNPANWAALADASAFMPVTGGVFTGPVTLPTGSTIAGYLPFAGGTLTGPLVLAADPTVALGAVTKQYADKPAIGVTDGSNALAGQVGEVIPSLRTTNAPFPADTPGNLTSILLTPGDWEISGEVAITPVTVGARGFFAAINTVSSTFPAAPGLNVARAGWDGIALTGVGNFYASLHCRANLTVTTTYFLVGQCNVIGGNMVGWISARRTR